MTGGCIGYGIHERRKRSGRREVSEQTEGDKESTRKGYERQERIRRGFWRWSRHYEWWLRLADATLSR
jgi:hypothetical protein